MDNKPAVRRRQLLGILAGSTTVAGCVTQTASKSEPPSRTDVIAGPDDAFVFEPEEFTIQVGESVTWYFVSPGHNVSCRPSDSRTAELPTGAEPFASYGPQDSPRNTDREGTTFTHTFDVPGDYVYVCIPHVTYDMVGTIHVRS
jgi:plastocyanin